MRRLWPGLAVLLLGLIDCRGNNLPPEYRALEVPADRLVSSQARERGRALYLEHCALCHGEMADGKGVRRNLSTRARSFRDHVWQNQTTPREIFFVIREGVQGTAMPAWKMLGDEETWDLVAYVHGVAEFGP